MYIRMYPCVYVYLNTCICIPKYFYMYTKNIKKPYVYAYVCIPAYTYAYLRLFWDICVYFIFLTLEIYTHTHSLSPKRKALDKLTPRKHQGEKKTSVPWFQPSFTMGMPVDPSWPNFFRQKVVRMVAGETPPSGTTSSITWENSDDVSTSVEGCCVQLLERNATFFDLSFIVIYCPDFWRALGPWQFEKKTLKHQAHLVF